MGRIFVIITFLTEVAVAIGPMIYVTSSPVATEKGIIAVKENINLKKAIDAASTALPAKTALTEHEDTLSHDVEYSSTDKQQDQAFKLRTSIITQNAIAALKPTEGSSTVAQSSTASMATGVIESTLRATQAFPSMVNSSIVGNLKLLLNPVNVTKTKTQTTIITKHSTALISIESYTKTVSPSMTLLGDYGFHSHVLSTSAIVFSVQSKTAILSNTPLLNIATIKASNTIESTSLTYTIQSTLETKPSITKHLSSTPHLSNSSMEWSESTSTWTNTRVISMTSAMQPNLLTSACVAHTPHSVSNAPTRNLPFTEAILRLITPSHDVPIATSSFILQSTSQSTANASDVTNTFQKNTMSDIITGLVIGFIIFVLVLVVTVKKIKKYYLSGRQRRQPQSAERMEMHFLNQYDVSL